MKLEAHFGLTRPVFPKAATADTLLHNAAVDHLLERLHFALERDTIALLVAESGCGKSTALYPFAKSLDAASYHVVSICLTTLKPFGLLAHLVASLGLARQRFKGECAAALLAYLRSQPKRTVVLVDEAHLLPDSCLEDLRLRTADNFDRDTPFSLVLVGQPILRERIAEPQHYALFQRIGVRLRLRPMNEQELGQFLERHMRAAGATSAIFAPAAAREIFHHSRGIPRLVQNLALEAMLAAMSAGKTVVDAEAVQQAIVDSDAT
jgi:type II secretory pathway predicted ATPase ExeA